MVGFNGGDDGSAVDVSDSLSGSWQYHGSHAIETQLYISTT
jgi:hypothetical protein